jgi:hypothetical protein
VTCSQPLDRVDGHLDSGLVALAVTVVSNVALVFVAVVIRSSPLVIVSHR